MAKTSKQARSERSRSSSGPARPSAAQAEALTEALKFLRLLWAIDHGLRSTSKQMQRRLGITAPQRLVLRFVGRQPDVLPSQLAALLHLDRGTLTGVIERLVQHGLLTRERHARDGRSTCLRLTTRGRRFDREMPGTVEHGVGRVLAALPAPTLNAAREVLEALIAELERPGSARRAARKAPPAGSAQRLSRARYSPPPRGRRAR